MNLTNLPKPTKRAFTLVEVMVATGLFTLAFAMVMSLFIFCLRGFAAMSNYAILDMENRMAMDKLSKEIRQADRVTHFSSNPSSLTLLDQDGRTISYQFNPADKTMTRTAGGESSLVLTNCEILNFTNYQRNMIAGTFGIYPIAGNEADIKVVELTWKTKRSIGGTGISNSENIQTARIVIRKNNS